MKRVLCMLLAFGWVTVALAQEEGKPEEKKEGDSKALEILKKLDAAAKKVQSVKYNAKYQGLGDAAARVPAIEGMMILAGESQGGGLPKKSYCEAKVKAADSSETKEYAMGGDGENYFLIDHAAKTAYEDIDPMVVGRAGQMLSRLAMIEFVHPTPYSDEINAESKEMKEDITVSGVDCYQIHVKYAGQGAGQEAIWYISKESFLPQRVDRIQPGPNGNKLTTSLELSNVEVDPKVEDSQFKLKLPEGYTKSDDYAP